MAAQQRAEDLGRQLTQQILHFAARLGHISGRPSSRTDHGIVMYFIFSSPRGNGRPRGRLPSGRSRQPDFYIKCRYWKQGPCRTALLVSD